MRQTKVNSNIAKLIGDKEVFKERVILPQDILSPRRLDLIIKSIYYHAYSSNRMSSFIRDLYIDHIRCINGFVESDDTKKVGPDSFLNAFNSLCNSVNEHGFDPKYKIVLSDKCNVLDGAHRLSTQLLENKPLSAIIIESDGVFFDYDFFIKRGMSRQQLDFVISEYVKFDERAHFVILWPVGGNRDNEVNKILKDNGEIIYHKISFFNQNGLTQLVRLAYSNESWLGDQSDGFAGARNKSTWCYADSGRLSCFIFRRSVDCDLITMKDEIRGLYGLGKHPVHINDTHHETIELSQLLLNSSSIFWANKSRLKTFVNLSNFILNFKSACDKSELDLNDFLIVGSIQAVYGIKDCNDFDYINSGSVKFKCLDEIKSVEYELTKMDYIEISNADLIYDPGNFSYFEGVKFLSLENNIEIKTARNRDNDKNDLVILNSLLSSQNTYSLSFFEFLFLVSKISFWKCKIKMVLLKARYYYYKVLKND